MIKFASDHIDAIIYSEWYVPIRFLGRYFSKLSCKPRRRDGRPVEQTPYMSTRVYKCTCKPPKWYKPDRIGIALQSIKEFAKIDWTLSYRRTYQVNNLCFPKTKWSVIVEAQKLRSHVDITHGIRNLWVERYYLHFFHGWFQTIW